MSVIFQIKVPFHSYWDSITMFPCSDLASRYSQDVDNTFREHLNVCWTFEVPKRFAFPLVPILFSWRSLVRFLGKHSIKKVVSTIFLGGPRKFEKLHPPPPTPTPWVMPQSKQSLARGMLTNKRWLSQTPCDNAPICLNLRSVRYIKQSEKAERHKVSVHV